MKENFDNDSNLFHDHVEDEEELKMQKEIANSKKNNNNNNNNSSKIEKVVTVQKVSKKEKVVNTTGVDFDELISKIDEILAKGGNVKMKNKAKFHEILSSTKTILSENKNIFNNLRHDSNMIKVFKELEQTIKDVKSKLDKLALINFCRDKAEKYLARVTENLQQLNMVLSSYLSGTNVKFIPQTNDNQDQIDSLTLKLASMESEIDYLKQKKKAEFVKVENPEKIDLKSNQVKLYKGMQYLNGYFGYTNYKLAYQLFNEICTNDNNNTEAKILLALMYEKGYYVEQSYGNAIELLQDAYEKGSIQAAFKLGQFAENNFYNVNVQNLNEKYANVESFGQLALYFYKIAAESGYSDAYARLGYIYENGILGIKCDEEVAVKYFSKSIEIDENPKGYNGIGNYYYETEQYKEAVKYYYEAAKGGDPNGANNLGMCYEYGKGIAQNYVLSLYYYKKACEQNLPVAFANQGILKIKISIENGEELDFQECFKLLELSISMDNTNKDAFYYLGLLFEMGYCIYNGSNKIQNEHLAFKYYHRAAELGHTKGKMKVGLALFNGMDNVFKSDETQGKALIKEAAQEGDIEAQKYLEELEGTKFMDIGKNYISS